MLKLNKNQEHNTMTSCANIISNYVGVYVFIMLVGFPLFVSDKYFMILEDKFYLFWISTAVVTALSAITALVFYVKSDKNGRDFKSFNLSDIVRSLRLEDMFFICFMAVSIISTVFSEWQYEAFWGNMGRYQGLFLWIWYAAAYVLISRFFRFRRVYIDVFLIAGAAVALLAITDYFQLDILGWQGAIDDIDFRSDFSSTIGNVNSLTAVLGMYLGVSALMFVSEDNKAKSVFYYLITVLMFTALAAAQSDNALLGIGVLLCFLPFFAWKNRRGFLRYFMVLTAFAGALLLLGILTSLHTGSVIPEWAFGVLLILSNKAQKLLIPAFTGLIIICLFIYVIMGIQSKKNNKAISEYMQEDLSKWFRIAWGILGIAAFVLLIMMFYDANHGGHPEFFSPLSNIFIFNDNWGTYRGYNWKLLLGYMSDFNLFNKLFGSGPETYGIYTKVYDYYSTIDFMQGTLDSPHNEFLQYLFCTGILGVVTYYGGVIVSCIKMFASKFNRISAAFAFAVIMYTAQSIINISAPVVTPMVIVLLSIGVNIAYRGEVRLNNKNE